MDEQEHLLSSPKNAERLQRSIRQAREAGEHEVLDDVLKVLRKLAEDFRGVEQAYLASIGAVSLIEGLRRQYNTGSPCEWYLGHCISCGSLDKAGCWFNQLPELALSRA